MIKYFDLKSLYRDEWLEACAEVLSSGWYLQGRETQLFEEEYARYIGTSYCVGCGNGLDALTLILRAYKELGRLKDGDEVLLPANTFIASVLAITENGLTPVMVDVDYDTLQIDEHLLEQAITPRSRALMLVHLYGRCAYSEHIAQLCRKHSLLLIEDNAQAHGCRPPQTPPTEGLTGSMVNGQRSMVNRLTGSLSDAAGHSFYPTKNLGAVGDAGAVTTNDKELADMVRSLANYGSSRKYVFDHVGRNSRIDELQAAVLRRKLPRLDADNQRRKEIATYYIQHITNPHIRLSQSDRDCVWHIFPVFCAERDCLQAFLLEQGIETQIHYPIPPHRQQSYKQLHSLSFPVTERLCAEELSLPCHPALTDAEVEQVTAAVNRFHP